MNYINPNLTQPRVNVSGASVVTGLSISTLNKLRITGGGPAYLKVQRRVLYDLADLDAWLQSKRRGSTSEAA